MGEASTRELGSIRHVFTHRDVTAHVFRVELAGRAGEVEPDGVRWVPLDGGAELAISSFTRKTLSLLEGSHRQQPGSLASLRARLAP